MKDRISKHPILISLILTPIALLLGYISVGAGHGDYVIATILFPYSILFILIQTPEVLDAFIFIPTVLQFPFYGVLIALGKLKDKLSLVSLALLLLHTISVILGLVYLDRIAY